MRGGAERHVAVLAPALRDRGFDVRVLALRRGGPLLDQLRREGIPAEIAGVRSRFDLAGFARAFALAKPAPNVVVSQSLNAQVLGHLIARRSRAVHLTIEQRGPGLG